MKLEYDEKPDDMRDKLIITVSKMKRTPKGFRSTASCEMQWRTGNDGAKQYYAITWLISKLPPIYKAHRLFVNNSDSERMSLTVGEALCAGCRVVSNHGNRGAENYRNLIVDYITEDLIARSYNLPDWDYLPNHDARQLTWDLVATRLIKVYEEVLSVR